MVEDPRGDTLKRGTSITLVLKEEAYDYLEQDTIKNLVKKYSQFINFNIYMWTSKTEQVDEPIDDEDEDEEPAEDKKEDEDEDAAVEEEKEEEEKKPKTKKVSKTTWDWELVNENKPVWTRDEIQVSSCCPCSFTFVLHIIWVSGCSGCNSRQYEGRLPRSFKAFVSLQPLGADHVTMPHLIAVYVPFHMGYSSLMCSKGLQSHRTKCLTCMVDPRAFQNMTIIYLSVGL